MIKKVSYTVTKSQVECYKFRAVDAAYWADVTIDTTPGAKHGRINIASDFGTWSYYWGACGSSFKEFLMGLDKHYVAKNFGADRFFDAKATKETYRRQIETCCFGREETTATELEVNDLYETPHIAEFTEQVRKSPRIMAMYDGMPDTCYRLEPGFDNFWEHIWPLLLDAFKEEALLVDLLEIAERNGGKISDNDFTDKIEEYKLDEDTVIAKMVVSTNPKFDRTASGFYVILQ